MNRFGDLCCRHDARRERIIEDPRLQGIDYLEVATSPECDNQRVLRIYFLRKDGDPALAALLNALDGRTDLVRIEGGVRIRDVQVKEVISKADHLVVRVDHPGDFTNYRLIITSPSAADAGGALLDPAYSTVEFNFQAGLPSRFDCRPATPPLVPAATPPIIDYLAKDYASFRQALLDRVAQIHPAWTERNPADLGMALIELLAYTGDQLSYYQDAVANEAFLETARQRISVRRHARLIAYPMHDGLSAQVFVHVDVGAHEIKIPPRTAFLPRIDEALTGEKFERLIDFSLRDRALGAATAIYETREEHTLRPMPASFVIHDWGRPGCWLRPGATTADLCDDVRAWLREDDLLLLEETRGRSDGAPVDLTHRQVVRIRKLELLSDPLSNQAITRVHWDSADSLRFPLCVTRPDGARTGAACGNILIAYHGRTVTEWHPCDPSSSAPEQPAKGIQPGARPYRFRLSKGPLSFCPRSDARGPVAQLMQPSARSATPEIAMTSCGTGETWSPKLDLLSSHVDDTHFVVEINNQGRAQVRFGDDQMGKAPKTGSFLQVTYRIGVGTPGRIAAEALCHVVPPDGSVDLSAINAIRNPLSSWGDVDPEPIEVVKLTAPAAMRSNLYRAVTEDDYARVAETCPDVSKAVAEFRWTGSWHTVWLTIDPRSSTELGDDQRQRILAVVRRHLQLGYDVQIDTPQYVPLDIEIVIWVEPDHFCADVEAEVALRLSNRALPGGQFGLFHPNRFTFGQTLYISQLYGAVAAVDGVRSATVTRFQRQGAPPAGELERGFIAPGPRQVLRLDRDPDFPEKGALNLIMQGGK